jgi:hypothetical protein
MSMIQYHPAPGLGLYMPGWFSVPQNPMEGGVSYTPRIGEILPGAFVVPQNPIKDYMNGRLNMIGRDPNVKGTVNGVSGCECGGTCGGCGGLGGISEDMSKISTDFSSGNYGQILQDTIFSIPVWAIAAGLGVMFFMGGETHSYYGRSRRAARAARAAYA